MPTITTRPPQEVVTGAQVILAFHGLGWRRADEMLNDPEGAALLALLCNATAKERSVLYTYKSPLIRWAVEHAEDWWATPHAGYGEYDTDTVIYIQHYERFSFHVRSTDRYLAELIQDAPRSERGWTGRALQPIARQLAEEWLSRN